MLCDLVAMGARATLWACERDGCTGSWYQGWYVARLHVLTATVGGVGKQCVSTPSMGESLAAPPPPPTRPHHPHIQIQ